MRVSRLNADLSVAEILPGITGGTVTYGSDRRRMCSIDVGAADGAWSPAAPGDAYYPNTLLRLERGVVIDGEPEYVPLGVFVVDRPAVTVTQTGARITVQGQDRLKLAAKSRFTLPTAYAEGLLVGDVIAAIAQDAGMGADLYRIDDGGKALAADRVFETGDNRTDAIHQLALDYALEVYVDADGLLAVEPALTEATIPASVWTFERGAGAIMLELTKGIDDDRLYNHVLVTGEASDLFPVRGEARDLNPDSPAYNPPDGTGPIGDRLYTYTSAMIRSDDQAQEVADATLLRVALVEETIRIPAIVHPGFEVGDVVTIIEPISRTSDTYLLDEVQIPLGRGAMSLGTRKLRSLT